jgi:hypothetical protein
MADPMPGHHEPVSVTLAEVGKIVMAEIARRRRIEAGQLTTMSEFEASYIAACVMERLHEAVAARRGEPPPPGLRPTGISGGRAERVSSVYQTREGR